MTTDEKSRTFRPINANDLAAISGGFRGACDTARMREKLRLVAVRLPDPLAAFVERVRVERGAVTTAAALRMLVADAAQAAAKGA